MEEREKMYKGHWLDSETYIGKSNRKWERVGGRWIYLINKGGKVECLRSGVYRSDILSKFIFEKNAFQTLIDNIDKLLDFVMRIELFKEVKDVDDYEDLRS